MMKVAVFEKDGAWWFKWWNFVEPGAVLLKGSLPSKAPAVPLAQDFEGPFNSKEDAERARDNFLAARRKTHPYEHFESI